MQVKNLSQTEAAMKDCALKDNHHRCCGKDGSNDCMHGSHFCHRADDIVHDDKQTLEMCIFFVSVCGRNQTSEILGPKGSKQEAIDRRT